MIICLGKIHEKPYGGDIHPPPRLLYAPELSDYLRLLWTFAGVLGGKIRMRTILKQNTANYISLESLMNVDFGKNINCRFLLFHKRKSQTTTKMTMCHSIELIGYQIQAHWQNNCTVLITKDQSSKV